MSQLLNTEESLKLGWTQSAYAVRGMCVSCPVCETLICSVHSDGSTACHGCDWKPGEFPNTPNERAEFIGVVVRRFRGKRFDPSDVRAVREFLLGIEAKTDPFVLKVRVTRQVRDTLDSLVGCGFYGSTPDAAAEEILRTSVRNEWRDWQRHKV